MSLEGTEINNFFVECAPNAAGFVRRRVMDDKFAKFRKGRISDCFISKMSMATPVSRNADDIYDLLTFASIVKSWDIPSMKTISRSLDEKSKHYESRLPMGRRLKAHWAMEGAQSTFVTLVMCLQIGLATWLLVRELNDKTLLRLLGWGVVLAKTSSGVLYPTLALLLLASSRALGTWLRRWKTCSRFVNWDLSQVFHIQMAIVALVFTILHVVGHLGGSFVHLSRSRPGEAAATLHNFHLTEPKYARLVTSLPGMTGILAFAILILVGLSSLPRIRQRHFECFQAVHLLVYPFIGLLMAHGTRGWLQAPMLGYWLAGPTLLLLAERAVRSYRYLVPVNAKLVPQQSDVVMLVLKRKKSWRIQPGQYVLLCVPTISLFQWHPFTVSSFSDDEIRVHIRTTSGSWTRAIGIVEFDKVLVDGPFGSPAEKFYGFDRTIVIGTGIGITPYIGVLSNKLLADSDRRRKSTSKGLQQSIDLHWVARDASVFSWFATLLNQVASIERGLRISTYLTAKPTGVLEHVFSVLVDRGVDTLEHAKGSKPPNFITSPLTGLNNPTHFGRPDFGEILERNQSAVPADFKGTIGNFILFLTNVAQLIPIGVFFCGPKYVGMELADRCKVMSTHSDQEVTWEFIGEVF